MNRLISFIVCGLVFAIAGTAATGEEIKAGFTATIAIGDKRAITYNNLVVTEKACVRSLEQLAKDDPMASVLVDIGEVRPDDTSRRETLRFIMDVCRHVGLMEVTISSIVQKNGAKMIARAKMPAEASKAEGNVQGSENVYWPPELDQMPNAIKQDSPVYPFDLRKQGGGGMVTVEFVVGRDGKVSGARAIKFAQAEFARAAVAAVSKWTFKPGRKGNVPVATYLQATVAFDFRDER